MRTHAEQLIHKALGRNNLNRVEQKELGRMLQDRLSQCVYQANTIRELRDEIIRLKIERAA